MSYTAFAAKQPLEKLLEEKGMLELYREIELPLVFAPHDMEKEGIRAAKDELKVYGTSCR